MTDKILEYFPYDVEKLKQMKKDGFVFSVCCGKTTIDYPDDSDSIEFYGITVGRTINVLNTIFRDEFNEFAVPQPQFNYLYEKLEDVLKN